MHEIVSKGVVDVFCCIEYGDLNAFKVLQYLGAVTEVDGAVFSPKFSVFISEAKWKQISPEDQAAIMKLSGEALARRSALIDEHNADLKKKYVADGGIVVTATPAFNAELKKAWEPLIEEWIAEAKASRREWARGAGLLSGGGKEGGAGIALAAFSGAPERQDAKVVLRAGCAHDSSTR